MVDDVYQERYLEHIRRKQAFLASPNDGQRTFWDILSGRMSQRSFTGKPLTEGDLSYLYDAIRLAPSSCNRQAILVQPITAYPDISFLCDILVGGKGWLSSAPMVMLLFADPLAYKAPGEADYMPYLDAGVAAGSVYLAAEALGVGCCYVNPNIRTEDLAEFDDRFNPLDLRFVGALALGYYDIRTWRSPKRAIKDLFYEHGE